MTVESYPIQFDDQKTVVGVKCPDCGEATAVRRFGTIPQIVGKVFMFVTCDSCKPWTTSRPSIPF